MNLVNCYRLLGLNSSAKLEDVKASYRRLAREYHPDVNPGNQKAAAHFIQVTEAYKSLLDAFESNNSIQVRLENWREVSGLRKVIKVTQEPAQKTSSQDPYEQKLKWNAYEQLQQLLKERRFPRAIALLEGLAQRLTEDAEVRQWLAIVYQLRGKQLLHEKQLDKAKIYLKKAVKTAPHNRSLCAEVERDFKKMERIVDSG